MWRRLPVKASVMDDQEIQSSAYSTACFLTFLRNYFLILWLHKSRESVLALITCTFSCHLEDLGLSA